MNKPTGELYIRREDETEYRNWSGLNREEIRKISTYLNLEAAKAGSFRQVAAGQLLATAFAVYGLWAWALLIWWLA